MRTDSPSRSAHSAIVRRSSGAATKRVADRAQARVVRPRQVQRQQRRDRHLGEAAGASGGRGARLAHSRAARHRGEGSARAAADALPRRSSARGQVLDRARLDEHGAHLHVAAHLHRVVETGFEPRAARRRRPRRAFGLRASRPRSRRAAARRRCRCGAIDVPCAYVAAIAETGIGVDSKRRWAPGGVDSSVRLATSRDIWRETGRWMGGHDGVPIHANPCQDINPSNAMNKSPFLFPSARSRCGPATWSCRSCRRRRSIRRRSPSTGCCSPSR